MLHTEPQEELEEEEEEEIAEEEEEKPRKKRANTVEMTVSNVDFQKLEDDEDQHEAVDHGGNDHDGHGHGHGHGFDDGGDDDMGA